MSNQPSREEQINKVFGYIKGLHSTYLMYFGVKLGLFKELARRKQATPPSILARQLSLDPYYVKIWCETACALEFLEYAEDGYRLSPHMSELLGNEESPYYLGLFSEGHLTISRDYANYLAFFRTGKKVPYQEHDEDFLNVAVGGLRNLPRVFVDLILPKFPSLSERLQKGARILDVGCGGGYAVTTFAERFPKCTCLGLDIEPVSIRLAKKLIEERGLSGKVDVKLTNGAEISHVKEFDLITMFQVFHEIRDDLKKNVLKACARALKEDGTMLIFDEAYPASPQELRDPSYTFTVIAQWFESSWGNKINTKSEIKEMLREQGLKVKDETNFSRFYIVAAGKA